MTSFFEDKTYRATVKSVGAMPGDDGLYTVKADVANKNDSFIAGDIAKLELPVKKSDRRFYHSNGSHRGKRCTNLCVCRKKRVWHMR
ncbi:hypothetical protein RWE15_06500 [Virgibacillus halophilus]|uniref:Uncharacterized protein n=1 Tax=Tigheibacillus halophilus TaxID=361280 RepID=A0ABU5C5Q1_9BACI|nr:hypothetical protein [Virgibacillus halophilus]